MMGEGDSSLTNGNAAGACRVQRLVMAAPSVAQGLAVSSAHGPVSTFASLASAWLDRTVGNGLEA